MSEMEILAFFVQANSRGELSVQNALQDDVEAFIWEQSLERSHALMRAWTRLRRDGDVRLIHRYEDWLGVGGGVNYPRLEWHIS